MMHCWHGEEDPNCKAYSFKKITLCCCRCKKFSGVVRWWERCRGLQEK